MSLPGSVGDADASILAVAGVPAAVAVAVAWLLPLHRTLQSGVATVVWLALLLPWLVYAKD